MFSDVFAENRVRQAEVHWNLGRIRIQQKSVRSVFCCNELHPHAYRVQIANLMELSSSDLTPSSLKPSE